MPPPFTAQEKIGKALASLSGGLVLAALLAGPWMYGSTRHWAIIRLCQIQSAAILTWIAGLAFQGRKPAIPRWPFFGVAFLFLQGWLVTLSPAAFPPDPFTVQHTQHEMSLSPGSFIVKTPFESMWFFSGLLGTFLVTVDLTAARLWWGRVYLCLSFTGVSIVLLGIVQILTGAKAILWQTDVPNACFFFGTFFHHSSAGAFVNLVWPLALGGLVAAWSFQASGWIRSAAILFWVVILLADLCGLFAQLSRFAQFNAFIIAAGFLAWLLWRSPKKRRAALVAQASAGALFVAVILGLAAVRLGKLPTIAGRWELLTHKRPSSPPPATPMLDFRLRPDGFIVSPQMDREAGARTCLRMLPDAGFLGFGPGRWSTIYPHFTTDPRLRTFFLWLQFAHDDFLQTWVEWGFLGILCWAFLIIGGIRCIFRALAASKRSNEKVQPHEGFLVAIALSLLGILLHSTLDFPLQIPAIQLYFAALLALAWGHYSLLPAEDSPRSPFFVPASDT